VRVLEFFPVEFDETQYFGFVFDFNTINSILFNLVAFKLFKKIIKRF